MACRMEGVPIVAGRLAELIETASVSVMATIATVTSLRTVLIVPPTAVAARSGRRLERELGGLVPVLGHQGGP